MIRRSGMRSVGLVALALVACSGDVPEPGAPIPGAAPVVTNARVDDKSKLYNLIGRWYPASEVQRLTDETLTPDEWCAKPPQRLMVLPDSIEVHCSETEIYTAPLASVRTSTLAGEVILSLRVGKDAAMRQIRFDQINGPKARVTGSPCQGGAQTDYERFPEYEVLTRQILNGRRCSQIELPEPSPSP